MFCIMIKLHVIFLLICVNKCISQETTTPVPAPIPAPPKLRPRNNMVKPRAQDWVKNDSRHYLAKWLLSGDYNGNGMYDPKNLTEYEGYDGWYNNLAKPDLGAIDQPLLRRWPAAYADGSYEPTGKNRPNPIDLSENLLKGDIGSKSKTGKNALLVFFGQQVVEEILDAQRAACPPEYFNIQIPEGHRYRNETGHTELPLLRTRYSMRTGYSPNNPRQQLNEITPYLDGGLIYGSTKSWSDYLRKYENGSIDEDGRLATDESKLFPAYNKERLPMANPPPPFHHAEFVKNHELYPVSRFFKLGNPRGNENTFLLSFGILWFRWHNYIADNIKNLYPDWDGEKIFNEARKWVIATQQHLVTNVWLPEWLGDRLSDYTHYDPNVDPQIEQFFQSAAMRFGHTLVVPGVYLRDYGRNGCSYKLKNWNQNAIRTCNSFWRPQDAILTKYNDNEYMDIDRVLMGMAVQRCEEEDHKIVEDLRGNVFGPLEFSRRDLMAINIQRARDHGIPDYNTARKAYNLFKVTNTSHFKNVHPTISAKMIKMYKNNWDNIDIWVAGIMETDDKPGELFSAIIKDQFTRIRNGDRFWFENKNNGLFNDAEIQRIKMLTVYDLIMAVTKMDYNDIPLNPFQVPKDLSEIHNSCESQLVSDVCMNASCFHLPQLNAILLNESCTTTATYDYFYNSEISYILSFLGIGLFIAVFTGVVLWITNKKINEMCKIREDVVRQSFKQIDIKYNPYTAKEWTGYKNTLSPVVIILNDTKRQIQVNTQKGVLIRAIDFSNKTNNNQIDVYRCTDRLHLMINIPNECSLVLKFNSDYLTDTFATALDSFIRNLNLRSQRLTIAYKSLLQQAITKEYRQKQLDMFFRVVFAQAFNITHSDDEIIKIGAETAKEIIYTELTIHEFAEAMAMKAESEFVRRIFSLIDRDRNGFVSFREFLDLLFIFTKGSGKDKAKVLFDMYDINGTGFLSEENFKNMIRSLLETVQAKVTPEDLEKTIITIKRDVNLKSGRMAFDDFYKIFRDDIEKIGKVNIEFKNAPQKLNYDTSYLNQAVDEIEGLYHDPRELQNRIGGNLPDPDDRESKLIDQQQEVEMEKPNQRKYLWYYGISRYIETNMREIFWITLYTIVLLAIFAERAYYYSVEREHSGLRRIAGYGVTVTRGAASAMMFTYSTLLLTMCRNIITVLRDSFFNKFIPFDSAVTMHKYIACWALFFTVMHIIGHSFNFYHISTQTADDLTCLFRNYFHATHELPKFHYWCWQTMTGITGVFCTLIGAVIYICAIPGVSRNLFWLGHKLYPFYIIFMFLHGTGRLIQEPFFPNFLVGPLFVYIIDMLITASRKKIEIAVLRAELLPSGVTMLEFKRPANFEYKSGQWVRVACKSLNSSEFHPFTLSSSPNESNLTIHIRAVGPWTRSIRDIYDSNNLEISQSLPKIHLDGPYGEGHQDWYRFDVSVLIGGGIGVTPFASILKDIIFRANIEHKTKCKKVYFIWVTKTQRQFEWLVDIIREIEASDNNNAVSIHLFITQFFQKFDLRTTLLYICERHFQRISGKSLFTGLKAVTHFGRPKFSQFFKSLQSLHPKTQNIGVFSCGPPPMTSSVERACLEVNKLHTNVTFHHHFKNF